MKSWIRIIAFILAISILNLSCSAVWKVSESELLNRDVKGKLTIVLKDGNEIEINKNEYMTIFKKGDYLFIQKDKLDSIKVNVIDSIKEERFSFGKTFFLCLGIIIIILFISSDVVFTKFT